MSETTQATAGTVATLQNVGKNTIAGNAAISAMISDSLRSAADSQKVQASIFNNMIAATSDYHKSQVDEWYKTEVLKQNEQQIEIERNYKAGLLAATEQRNNILAGKARKEATITQLSGVATKELSVLKEQYDTVAKELPLAVVQLNGGKNPATGEFIPAPIPGTAEYDSAKARLDQLNSKKEYTEKRASEIGSYLNDLRSGIYDTDLPQYNPETGSTVTEEEFRRSSSQGQQPNPILPNGSGSYDPLVDEADAARIANGQPPMGNVQYTTPAPTPAPKAIPAAKPSYDGRGIAINLEEIPKQIYRDTNSARSNWSQMATVDGGKLWNQETANKVYSQLSPEAKKEIDSSRTAVKASLAQSLGRSFIDYSPELNKDGKYTEVGKSEEDALKRASENYRANGGDVNDLYPVVSNIKTKIDNYLVSKEYNDIGKDIKWDDPNAPDITKLQKNAVKSEINKIIQSEFYPKDSSPSKEPTDAKKEEVGKSSIIKSALREDGSIGEPIIIGDKTKSDDAKRKIRISSSNDFMETFVDAQTGKLNLDFVSFVNRYAKPEDFGISIDTPLFNEFTTGEEVHSAIVKKEKAANVAKQKVLTDINAAYIFWMKKANPEKSQLLNLE